MERVIHPFDPVSDSKSKILILGTMPSPTSRETGFYYSHQRNRFWKVLSLVVEQEFPATIPERKAFLLKNRIALWDVLGQCEIQNAEDGSIENPIPNNLLTIFNSSDIQAVFTNGKTPEKLYKKYWAHKYPFLDPIGLPSTSPSNCRWSLGDLVKEYEKMLPFLK